VATLFAVALIVWVFKEAAEDTIRTARGASPSDPRKGFRGYLDDRWKAIADRHHRIAESGHITAFDAHQRRRHLAREKALKFAGFKTDEAIAKAAQEHRRRMALIEQGPDARPVEPLTPEPATETQAEPWSPYANNPNTDTKEHHTMVNTGEITGPAGVKLFHDDLKAVMDGTVSIADTLAGLGSDLEQRAADLGQNLTATETAAAGMTRLGMSDAAVAAMALMDTQKAIQDAMNALAAAVKEHAGAILDQAGSATAGLRTIETAYDAQMRVKEARVAAGRGNLAEDDFLDNND
jgi:hypothetical protein